MRYNGWSPWVIAFLLELSLLFYFSPYHSIRPLSSATDPSTWGLKSTKPKYAFATLLTSNDDADPEDDESDWYFQMTRAIIYKLLHEPSTRSDPSIPFVILVTPDYGAHKRERLKAYGAEVREVSLITSDWVKPLFPGRWHSVLTKLRVFQMTEYEKILFIEPDHMILRRIDGVFDSVNMTQTGRNVEEIKDDEGPLPEQYLMAGRPELPIDGSHTYPPVEDDPKDPRFSGWMNCGFFLVSPLQELFDHYMAILSIEDLFDSSFPEQNLISYAHRLGGNMPWTHLDWHWNMNWPRFEDVEQGVRSFHSRYYIKMFDNDVEADWRLQEIWWAQANEAKGYFMGIGIDEPIATSSELKFHFPE